jgi:hypothetical protein
VFRNRDKGSVYFLSKFIAADGPAFRDDRQWYLLFRDHKETRVCFAKSERPDISPVKINNKEIDLTSSAKILGFGTNYPM